KRGIVKHMRIQIAGAEAKRRSDQVSFVGPAIRVREPETDSPESYEGGHTQHSEESQAVRRRIRMQALVTSSGHLEDSDSAERGTMAAIHGSGRSPCVDRPRGHITSIPT